MQSPAKVALITGASAGIGAVYADRLAARGHDLVLVARRRDRLDELAGKLREKHPCDVEVVVTDLSQADDLARVERIIGDAPDLAAVVNNAGIGALGSGASVSPDEMERMIRLNVVALTRLSLSAARRFSTAGRGTIVNIGSVIALTPRVEASGYSGSKAYVLNFTRSLQAELVGTDVVVQAVMPGPVRTEFFGDGPPPFADELLMTPEAVVDAALAGLDLGETVTFPNLERVEAWLAFEQARETLFSALREGNRPASRYAARGVSHRA